eukprot:g23658.t1
MNNYCRSAHHLPHYCLTARPASPLLPYCLFSVFYLTSGLRLKDRKADEVTRASLMQGFSQKSGKTPRAFPVKALGVLPLWEKS